MNRKMLYMIVSITLMISLSACGSVNNKPVSVGQTTGINNSVNSGTNEDNTTNTGSDVISDEDNSINKADNYNVENGTKEYRGFVLDNVLQDVYKRQVHRSTALLLMLQEVMLILLLISRCLRSLYITCVIMRYVTIIRVERLRYLCIQDRIMV